MSVSEDFLLDLMIFRKISEFIHFSEMGEHLVKHGDGVKDVAFEVEDLDNIILVRCF